LLLDEIGAYLVAQGIGTLGTDLFLGEIPPKAPDAAVGLIETGGRAPEHTFGSAVGAPAWESPSLQVLARAKTYVAARNKAHDIYKKLDGLSNTTLSGVFYLSVFAIQSPFALGRDDADRELIAFNCAVKKKAAL
jgi:hypothetical protein